MKHLLLGLGRVIVLIPILAITIIPFGILLFCDVFRLIGTMDLAEEKPWSYPLLQFYGKIINAEQFKKIYNL